VTAASYSYSSSSSSSIGVNRRATRSELTHISPIGPIGPIRDKPYRCSGRVTVSKAERPDRGRGRRRERVRKLTLPPDPATSNTRTNKSLNYGRQPIPVGGHSHRLERTISTRNCLEPRLVTHRIAGLTDLSLPCKPHTDSAGVTRPDECKSRCHPSTEWPALRQ
jgi:hypothetical protein